MSDPFRDQPLPRGPFLGMAALVVFSLVAVIVAQNLGYKGGQAPPDSVVESRDLRFIDGPDGLVHVRDVSSNAVVTSLAPGTENFIRGVLRGMARERRSRSLDTQTPFRIARHADGRLTLEDIATGRRIDLQAFGPSNAGSFERLLVSETSGT